MRWMLAAAVVLATACSHNVKQDYNTGDDGRIKTAKPVTFNDTTTKIKLHDIVTYPGGDRIDWRKLELPKDKVGVLSVTLKWKTPRPGLALGFDVFDQYGKPIASEKGKHGSNQYVRKADIPDASGTYLFRVYALERGDAGAYTVTLAFAENPAPDAAGFPPPASAIPDPPHLPAVVAPVVCDASNYKTTKGCEAYCPVPVDPQWPGCSNQCPQIQDVNIPACAKIMPCDPNAWDSRIKACKKVQGPVCPAGVVASTTCVPPPPAGPEKGKIANIQQQGDQVDVKFTVRKGHPIQIGWKGYLVDDKGGKLASSDFTVYKIGTREVWGKIKLTSDMVDGHKALISPP